MVNIEKIVKEFRLCGGTTDRSRIFQGNGITVNLDIISTDLTFSGHVTVFVADTDGPSVLVLAEACPIFQAR